MRLPSRPFSGPQGFYPRRPGVLLPGTLTLCGFSLLQSFDPRIQNPSQGLQMVTRTFPRSSRGEPSSTFLSAYADPRPRGFLYRVAAQRTFKVIFRLIPTPVLSWAFAVFVGLSVQTWNLDLRGSSAHGLDRSPAYSVFPFVQRHLSLARAPTTLTFLAIDRLACAG